MLACEKTFDLSKSIVLAAHTLNFLIKPISWGFLLSDSLSRPGIKSYHLQIIKFCLFLSNNLNLVSASSYNLFTVLMRRPLVFPHSDFHIWSLPTSHVLTSFHFTLITGHLK